MDIYEAILRLEQDANLFALEYKGVAWWNLLRFTLIYDLILSEGTAGMHPDAAARVQKRIPLAALAAALRGIGQLFSRRQYDALLHACDDKLGDYFDEGESFTFLRSSLAPLSSYTKTNPPSGIDNALPTLTYLPGAMLAGVGRRMFGAPEVPGLRAALQKVGEISGEELDFSRYNAMVMEQCRIYRHYYRFYRRALKGRFRLVVTGCHYTTETFALIRAAQSMGLRTAELQHGVTGPRHAGYNVLPQAAGAVYFPDVLLSYGDYWNSVTRTPPGCKPMVVGYPAFDRSRAQFEGAKKDTGPIVFYSQGAVSRQMADFVLDFHRLGTGRRVLLKLHPNEYQTWKERTPRLIGSGVEVLDSPMNVHQLLAGYQNHVGAFSTVLYEAVAFPGNRVFTVEPISYRYLDKMVDSGYILAVQTPEELAERLSDDDWATPPDPDTLFRPGAKANVMNTIGQLLCGG